MSGFNPAAAPRDRTSAWLIVGTLAALAILFWAAWADTQQPREVAQRPHVSVEQRP